MAAVSFRLRSEMRSLLICFALLAAFLTARADDELVSIDPQNGLITVQQKNALKGYRLKAFTDVTINGQKATAAQLKPGMDVVITLADPQTASKIAARGNVALPSGAATRPVTPARPPIGGLSQPLTRKILFKAVVDGDDWLIIQDGKIRIQHGGWQKPENISVNGIKWKPEWEGNNSDDFVAFAPPLAPFAGATVTMKMVKGRGVATMKEPPTDANGHTARIHLEDKGGGASEFEVRVAW